jgi:8-hydroxy-5-deazaflavin:NADPH oxidoreductase
MPKKPSVGILGSGNMGKAFTEGLRRAGYPVAAAGHDIELQKRVAAPADVVIVAVPYVALDELLPKISASLRGKVVVDITNLMGPKFTFLGGGPKSGAEAMQAALPGARVVKAFNTVFSAYVDGGKIAGETLTAFVAGDDAGSKRTVLRMAKDLGLDPVDAGPLARARELESVGYFHIVIYESVGWDHGLRLVRSKKRSK